jgi:hypothetical protein
MRHVLIAAMAVFAITGFTLSVGTSEVSAQRAGV